MSSSNELDLNAFVDGELTADQQAEFLEAMRDDPELARQACELGQLKAQLRLAYASPPPPRLRGGARVGASWRAIAASGILLVLGVVAGWLLPDDVERNRFVVLDADGRGQTPATAANDETRIVFHLTNADPLVAAELLDEVEGMLAAYQADHRPLRVEVVSHSDGLALLRQSLTAYGTRIHELAQRFPNLTFVACRNTIDRLRVERGIEVRLVPDAEVIDSGVNHVVRRQKEGWSYIRV
ncbi:MAG: hypothetical protein H6959_07990 [Chromatiaceae bacterium]|nr:hypothetical protein [Gammaproteobacteria bacterium]MCP5300774.1 hypothetical protein [Chromatiaceae bacterium]MCP5422846.1 hypothetical protein [Chromatiaceae bacterium]